MRCEETNSPATISPKHTFQGAFFIPSLSLCSAHRSHKVEAVPETAVSPSPLKSYSCLGGISSSSALPFPTSIAWLLPVGTCPGGYFVLGTQNYFLFWKYVDVNWKLFLVALFPGASNPAYCLRQTASNWKQLPQRRVEPVSAWVRVGEWL